ncbi:MAG: zinc-binding dehydrogenase [Acidimicrobiia bacterium]|nr:zinc-binding dehydrogenase [Acidimicrobiia bacterium]
MSAGRQWWVVPGPDGGRVELRSMERPEPAAGQVVVQVRAAGVNRGELIGMPLVREGTPGGVARPSGIEFAGEVAALGEGVGGWSVGQRVMGRGSACHADWTTVAARALMAVPDQLDDPSAAAIPNVFVTAHDALTSAGGLAAGETVLITAGSSGVGTAAIQLARMLGAGTVLVTSRSLAKAGRLRELGADGVVDTTVDGWPRQVRELTDGRGIDLVIDQVGGALFPGLMKAMALHGRFVGVGRNDGAASTIDLDLLARNQLRLIGVTFRTRTAEEALAASEAFVAQCGSAVADGRLQPVLDRTFPLDDLPAAHRYLASDAQIGKVVLVA